MSRVCSDARQGCVNCDREAQFPFANKRLKIARDIQNKRTEHDRLWMHLKSACGDLGNVQDLIHEVAQMCGGGRDAINGKYLPCGKLSVESVMQ